MQKKINATIIISNSGAKVNCFAFLLGVVTKLMPIAPCESYNSEPCSTGPFENMVNCSSLAFSLINLISAQHLPTFHSFLSLRVIVMELLLLYLTCVF